MTHNATPFIVQFGKTGLASNAVSVAALGQRGAALCSLATLHLPVPPGFVLSAAACRAIAGNEVAAIAEIRNQISVGLSGPGVAGKNREKKKPGLGR